MMDERRSKVRELSDRVDKLTIALTLLLNALHSYEVVDGKKVVSEIDEGLLKKIERLLNS